MKTRLQILQGLMLLSFAAVASWYTWMMVVSPARYASSSYDNSRIRAKIEEAVNTGAIFERDGEVQLDPTRLDAFYATLARRFIRLGYIRAYEGRVVVEKNITLRRNPGLDFRGRPLFLRGAILDRNGQALAWSEVESFRVRRNWRNGPAFFHVLGIPGARFATGGIEKAFDSVLSSPARPLVDRFRSFFLLPVAGKPVATTLDANLQEAAYRAFAGRPGAAVVLDIRTGEILAMVSSPSISPDSPARDWFAASDLGKEGPLVNRVLDKTFAPGSTFKTIIAAAALETGLAVPSQPLVCRGAYQPLAQADFRIHDHEKIAKPNWPGHNPDGNQGFDIGEAYINSCNCVFARLGTALGKNGVEEWAQRFGFGTPIPIYAGPSAEPLRAFPSVVWSQAAPPKGEETRRITRSHVAQAAIGQYEVRATPLQMALVAATVANNGVMCAPRLIHEPAPLAKNALQNTPDYSQIGQRVLSPETASLLRVWMRGVVEEGTGRNLGGGNPALAGKTGTAQQPGIEPHAWFIGFAPVEKPRIAFAVVVENGGFGSSTAGPIAVAIVRAYLPERLAGLSSTVAHRENRIAGNTPIGKGETR